MEEAEWVTFYPTQRVILDAATAIVHKEQTAKTPPTGSIIIPHLFKRVGFMPGTQDWLVAWQFLKSVVLSH